jgi:lysozyme family protein
MANFESAYLITSKNEGLYANNPNDNGGETYAGISRKFWPKWSGWVNIDAIKKKVGTSASAINKSAVADDNLHGKILEFYKVNLWYPLHGNEIADQQLANVVYDFAVNAGVSTSARALQHAANSICGNLVVDGEIGAKTIDAVNKLNAKQVYNNFNVARKAHYDRIVAGNPSQKQFYAGWISRIKPYKSQA